MPAECFDVLEAVEEVFFEIGFDLHLPDVGQVGRQVFVQEEGVADFVVGVTDLVIESLEDGQQLFDFEVGVLVVVAQDVGVGGEADEGEAAAEGVVDQGDGAIGRIHRANEANIFGDFETPAAGEGDAFLAVFEQVHQFAEDAGQVGAVDFIDDEDAEAVAVGRFLAEFEEAAGDEGVGKTAVFARLRPNPLNKIFIGVGRVELDEFVESRRIRR